MKLYKLADRLEAKYFTKLALSADDMRESIVAHIKQSLANASTVTTTSGIMPFVTMLNQDSATLSFTITRDGKDITVSNFSVNPNSLNPKYLPLMGQIKKYLEKNWELFPSQANGSSISYDNFTFNLQYGSPQNIANDQ